MKSMDKMIDENFGRLAVESVEKKFAEYFEKHTQKPWESVSKFFINSCVNIDGAEYHCSYFGYIYENIEDNIAIEDFAKEISTMYGKYTVLGQMAPIMKMQLASTPQYSNRFALLYYVFIKEFPNGAQNFKEGELPFPFIFDVENLSLKPRMSGEPRKHVKVFRIKHQHLLGVEGLENDFEKVKAFFSHLPEDLEYVETLPMFGPAVGVLCTSKTFPENEVEYEYSQGGLK